MIVVESKLGILIVNGRYRQAEISHYQEGSYELTGGGGNGRGNEVLLQAHNVVSITGNAQGHQHVYRHQQYGKPLQQGHRVQSSGGRGPVIDGRKSRPGAKTRSSSKYGSAVSGYGKPVQGYGKAPLNK